MMLSRSSIYRSVGSKLSHVNKRCFFDYIKFADGVDKGKSLEVQKKENEAKKDGDTSKWNWNWIEWFEQYQPERMAEIKDTRSKYHKYEEFVGSQDAKSVSTINFSQFRNKIADPSFVDELEIDYYVNEATLNSIENMKTLEKWKSQSINQFKKESESLGDLIWEPMTKQEKQEIDQKIETAEGKQLKLAELLEEAQKDYEQIDAERMIYGHETLQMKYSEHPQFAENQEDAMAARQSFNDYLLMPWNMNQVKHERLATMQDENRRKLFLQRFEWASKVINGEDLQASGGGH